MSKIEDLIRKHKELADYREPFSGHDVRFRIKYGFYDKPERRMNYMVSLIAIASVMTAAVILSGIFTGSKNTLAADMPQEIIEVIFYYDNISADLFDHISQIKREDIIEFNQIEGDIKSLDKWETLIMNDFRKYPNDERVQNALIEFHKNKAEMLNDLYEQIKRKDFETIYNMI